MAVDSAGTDLVVATHDERVLHVRMCAPPVNAFGLAFFEQLHAALLDVRPETGAIVVTSDLPTVFAAGGDLPYMAAADHAASEHYVKWCQKIYGTLESTDVVSIVAIDGPCLAGGLELALAADVRIASPGSRLGLPEIGLGILAGAGAIHRVAQAVGLSVARDLLLTGEPVSAVDAHRWGLVTRLADDPVAEALRLAARVSRFSPEAVEATKALALSAPTDDLDAGLALELERWLDVRRGANAQEGLDAFAEKRPPRFEPRRG